MLGRIKNRRKNKVLTYRTCHDKLICKYVLISAYNKLVMAVYIYILEFKSRALNYFFFHEFTLNELRKFMKKVNFELFIHIHTYIYIYGFINNTYIYVCIF